MSPTVAFTSDLCLQSPAFEYSIPGGQWCFGEIWKSYNLKSPWSGSQRVGPEVCSLAWLPALCSASWVQMQCEQPASCLDSHILSGAALSSPSWCLYLMADPQTKATFSLELFLQGILSQHQEETLIQKLVPSGRAVARESSSGLQKNLVVRMENWVPLARRALACWKQYVGHHSGEAQSQECWEKCGHWTPSLWDFREQGLYKN